MPICNAIVVHHRCVWIELRYAMEKSTVQMGATMRNTAANWKPINANRTMLDSSEMHPARASMMQGVLFA
jgi:hypothetical protein